MGYCMEVRTTWLLMGDQEFCTYGSMVISLATKIGIIGTSRWMGLVFGYC